MAATSLDFFLPFYRLVVIPGRILFLGSCRARAWLHAAVIIVFMVKDRNRISIAAICAVHGASVASRCLFTHSAASPATAHAPHRRRPDWTMGNTHDSRTIMSALFLPQVQRTRAAGTIANLPLMGFLF